MRHSVRYRVVMTLVAAAALASACASTGTNRPRPFPTPAGSTNPEPTPATPPVPPRAAIPSEQLVATALSFRGVPYRNGGSDPTGFDCSGFTQWVFAQHGIALPREVEQQFKVGEKVKQDDLKPGDLVFFRRHLRGGRSVRPRAQLSRRRTRRVRQLDVLGSPIRGSSTRFAAARIRDRRDALTSSVWRRLFRVFDDQDLHGSGFGLEFEAERLP